MIGHYQILIVDDSNFIRLTLKKYLQSQNSAPISVTEAADGVHALEILSQNTFDMILTDLEMPRMDGLELITELRGDSKYNDTPIIFLTSVDAAARKVAAFESGATDYIIKPFIAAELIARILAHLERKFMTEAVKKKAKVSESLTTFYRRLRSIDLTEVEKTVSQLLINHFRIGSISLWECDQDEQLRLTTASDELIAELPPITNKNSPMWRAFEEKKPIYLENPNPEVVESLGFHLDAYSGSPITLLPLFNEVQKVGILNLTNFPDDFFLQYELTHLEAIQHYVSNALQNAMSYHLLRKKQIQTEQELEQAKITQQTVLPQKAPDVSYMSFATKYVSMDQIGGDLYDVIQLADNKIGVLVADVTGHGIPAALISCMASSLFRAFNSVDTPPDQLFSQINKELFSKIPDGKFLTAFYCIYDAETQELIYSIGGHPEGYLIRGTPPESIPLNKDIGLPLGIFGNDIAEFNQVSIPLQVKDRVVIYTDGIVEIMNSQQDMFGHERLQAFLKEYHHLELDTLLEELYLHALSFSEKKAFDDDITLVAFEIN